MPRRPPVHISPHSKRAAWSHPRGKETAAARGYGKEWSTIRAHVLAEEPCCRYCLTQGKHTRATTVDHIRPKARGGTDARSNLCGCCDQHQRTKAAREGAQGYRLAALAFK
jgi:5-methylcytosine-specific restriction protein A